MNDSATQFSPMQQLKRRIYAMRNGIVADTLRRSGCPHQFIFGLNLPQLVEIAAEQPHTVELAEQLWADSNSRESMLLAPMLYPVEALTRERAAAMARQVRWSEDADILCHRLLRHAPFAIDLAAELVADPARLTRYTGLRLLLNLLNQPAIINHPAPASTPLYAAATAALAQEQQRPDPLTALTAQLQDQLAFLAEC